MSVVTYEQVDAMQTTMTESQITMLEIKELLFLLTATVKGALIIGGVVLSFYLVRFLWRLMFVPILRKYMNFNL